MVLRRILSFRRNSNRIKNLNKSTRSKSPGLSPGELEEKKFDFETKKRLNKLKEEHLNMLKDDKVEEELEKLLKSINSPSSLKSNQIKKSNVINIDVNGTKYNVGRGKNKKSKRKPKKPRKNKKTKKK